MITFNSRRDWKGCSLTVVLWVVATSWAHADQERTEQAWSAFIAPIEAVFSEKLDHFRTFSESVFPRTIHDLRLDAKGYLVAQTEEDAPYLPAPEDFSEQVAHSFRALGLFGVRSDDRMVELAPATFAEFNGIHLFLSVVYAPELSFADHHCGARTIIDGVDGGRCWWPLPERGWYVDLIWPEHGAMGSD